MDEITAVTKQLQDEGDTLALRVGEREYFRVALGDRRWWYAQRSDSRSVDEATSDLLDALAARADELSPEEPKPLDVDEVVDDLVEHLRHDHEAQTEELGHAPTRTERYRLCPSELADQLYGRTDSVAVAAVSEALQRPYLNYGTVDSVFGGTQECC